MPNQLSILYRLKELFQRSLLFRNIVYTLFFGGLSLLLGELKFYIPDFEGGTSDFREIPLIISVFYIKNPVYLAFLSLITALGVINKGIFVSAFIVHLLAILTAFLFSKWIDSLKLSNLMKGLVWVGAVLVYYLIVLIPPMIVLDYLLGTSPTFEFVNTYVYLVDLIKFEMIATAFIAGLYNVQFNARQDLVEHKENLEYKVEERTQEIAEANSRLIALNEELMASSEQIRSMNENLDELVKERSKKIEEQLQILVKYAHMNAHDVRAPLARILGLLSLLEKEESGSDNFKSILKMLYESSVELDSVVRQMNRLLETEIVS